MVFKRVITAAMGCLLLAFSGCASHPESIGEAPWHLKTLLAPVRQAVVTVVNYDVFGQVSSVGSGFFITKGGVLLTNHHVLEGAYSADVHTADGDRFPVTTVISASQLVDLVKVRVDIPDDKVFPIRTATEKPAVADRVFVVGSPMGLDQTVSEGIVSAIRDMPTGGSVLQLTAPISQGSSGGPVFNQQGDVVGVVTFQSMRGQNLNFAISIDALGMLPEETTEHSIAEWTINNSGQTPALAATLCNQGARLNIQGEFEAALDYFKRAAETTPDDPDVWYGLGSCYVGLDQPDDAIQAYQRPIEQDPDNATAHFILAMYYKTIGQYENEIEALSQVLRIDPINLQARFELGRAYSRLERYDDQIRTFNAILADRPNHVPALIGLGAAFAEQDRLNEALNVLLRASDLEPDNPAIHYDVGILHERLDQPGEAARAYIRAIRLNPRMVPAHFNLGMVYLGQGNTRRTLGQYEILKELDDDAADILFEKLYPESRQSGN